MKMKLEVMLHMNKVNPEISLTEEQAINLWRQIVILPGTLKQTSKVNYGYRGIFLTGEEDSLTVFNEYIEVVSPGGIRWFIDQSRKFEEWLLEIAKPIIPDDSMITLIAPNFKKDSYCESYY